MSVGCSNPALISPITPDTPMDMRGVPDRQHRAAGFPVFGGSNATAIATLAGRWTGQTPRTPSALLPVPLDPRRDNHGCPDLSLTLPSITELDSMIHLRLYRYSRHREMDHQIKLGDRRKKKIGFLPSLTNMKKGP